MRNVYNHIPAAQFQSQSSYAKLIIVTEGIFIKVSSRFECALNHQWILKLESSLLKFTEITVKIVIIANQLFCPSSMTGNVQPVQLFAIKHGGKAFLSFKCVKSLFKCQKPSSLFCLFSCFSLLLLQIQPHQECQRHA